MLCVWLDRVQEELCAATPHLLECSSGNVSCTQALLLLVLAGRTQPGQRSEVGFLRWGGEEAEHRLSPVSPTSHSRPESHGRDAMAISHLAFCLTVHLEACLGLPVPTSHDARLSTGRRHAALPAGGQ